MLAEQGRLEQLYQNSQTLTHAARRPTGNLQKPTVVQWDIGAMPNADGAADESVSPQSGISRPVGEIDQLCLSSDDALLHAARSFRCRVRKAGGGVSKVTNE